MLFNSYVFIFGFLPVTLLVYFGLIRLRYLKAAIVWMAIASLFFYGYWNPPYLLLLLLSISLNYGFGRAIASSPLRSDRAKFLLIVGILINLAFIGYYKYAEFFLSSLNQVFNWTWQSPDIVLPLAISFYTFTQIAYLVDAYRGETKDSNYDLVTYSLFVSFYPQLIAGPILRHDELIPEFRSLRNFIFSEKNFALGLTLFILGLSKKMLIADNLSPWVALVFNNAESVTFVEAWIGALSYTFQLYFDFSGYSDMAIGLGWMVNINLPINFNSPYKASSMIDFWRRWHITLSAFLRDYLYIPLGGNRKGETRRIINLMVTMLLGGLWHGAGWTYVIWGGMHGLFLCINHSWRKLGISLPKFVGVTVTFLAVVASWVVFRAATFQDALELLQAMAGMKAVILPTHYQGILGWLSPLGLKFQPVATLAYLPRWGVELNSLILLGVLLIVMLLPNALEMVQKFKTNWVWTVGIASLAAGCFISLNQVSEFLYFQF
ncbi:MBOAT family O-acyltransferase [Laspinema olomoucense]|uniref:MBOAT family O-acyltransferase n=1 Tax=Laspinema olomoucense TaxID=3231600 RepID=UPI0021BA9105|nr:MBOAT family O-acyltransferase [Laspinema sp. D3a]MCT7988536.1 MBOAT family protein [Laspinema sp. D3a]